MHRTRQIWLLDFWLFDNIKQRFIDQSDRKENYLASEFKDVILCN
jgi:hypothetical protein